MQFSSATPLSHNPAQSTTPRPPVSAPSVMTSLFCYIMDIGDKVESFPCIPGNSLAAHHPPAVYEHRVVVTPDFQELF